MQTLLSWSRPNVIWPLRVIAGACLIGPLLLFAYSAHTSYRAIDQQASERLERALDVLQEHAHKAFQTLERSIAETNEVLRGLPDEDIRADQSRISERLKQIKRSLPHMEAVWAFDRHGRPLASSTIVPVPATLNNSDRDYFRAHAEADAGTYIGDVVEARIGSLRFFVVSGRRREAKPGDFNGVIAFTVLPEHFRDFYARLARGVADSFGLIRADGAFLARFPQVSDRPERLGPDSGFIRSLQEQPSAGVFTATSQIDGIERRIGYRKVPDYPIYIQAGIETGALRRALMNKLGGELAFGLPATLAMFVLAVFALRRTENFHTEIARREQAEAALKQAQRLEALGQLTGGVAHDFNNLLMVVSGSLERLRRYPWHDERQKRALDAIDSSVQRGTTLTRQLLSFSRRQTHEPGPVALAEHLGGLEDMLRSSLRGNIELHLDVSGDLWPILVDISEFELALLNIAVNARDAMPDGGQLTISARNVSLPDATTVELAGDFVSLSFVDTGTGIPDGVLSRVFEPFFTTKEVGKGTGLGLSQVYGFTQQSGGSTRIASQPGKGTTVTLYLPRATGQADEAKRGQAPAVFPSRGSGGRALLVEDNEDVAEITRGRLEELGYRVAHIADGVTAADIVRHRGSEFDLVFSDIVMPGDVTGLDLARLVREELRGRMSVVLATGYSDVAQSATEEGFIVLRKPYDLERMHEAISRATGAAGLKVVA